MKLKFNRFLTASLLAAGSFEYACAATYQYDANNTTAGLGISGTTTVSPTGAALQWDLVGTDLDDGTDTCVGYPNSASDTYEFGGTAGTINPNGSYSFSGAVNFTVAGYTLKDSGGNGDIAFSGLVTVGGTGITTFQAGGAGFGDVKFNGGLSISSGATAKIGVRGNAANAISRIGTSATAALTGAGGLQFFGDNIIDVWGVNSGYTGAVEINMTGSGDGVRLNSDGALGSEAITLTKGYLNLNAKTIANSVVLNNTSGADIGLYGGTLSGLISEIGGARALRVTQSLTLSNTGNHTFTGAAAVTAGTLTLEGGFDAATTTTVSSGATLEFSGAGSTAGNITLLSGGKLDTTLRSTAFSLASGKVLTAGRDASPAIDIEGDFASTGTISPAGNGVIGTLTINGGLDLAGGTVEVDLGAGSTADVIDLNSAAAFVASAPTVINLSGTGAALPGTYTLVVNSNDIGSFDNEIDPSNLTVTGTTLTPSWDVSTAGTLKLVLTAASAELTWNGTTAPGNLWNTTGANTNWLNGVTPAAFSNGDQVTFDGSAAENSVDIPGTVSPLVFNVSGTSDITLGGSGSIAGTSTLTKSGAGNLTINTQNTYSGGTIISAGTVTLGHPTDTLLDTGDVTVGGGALALGANSDTVGAVSLTSGSITGTGELTGSSYALEGGTVSAILAGAGTLTKTTAGTVILGSDNTYSGLTTVSAGTLQLGTGGTTGSVAGAIANSGGVAFNRSDALVLAGTLTGTGSVTITGGGSVALAGNSSASALTLDNGTLATGTFAQSVSNNLTIEAAGGGITGSGALLMGNMTLNGDGAIENPITLTNGGATWSGSSVLTLGANVSCALSNDDLFLLTGGTIKLAANVAFNQTANAESWTTGLVDLNGNTLNVNRGGGNTEARGTTTLGGLTGTGAVLLTNSAAGNKSAFLRINGNNTGFTGTVEMAGTSNVSTLKLGNDGALGTTTSTLTITNTCSINVTAARTLTASVAQNWNADWKFTGSFDLNTGTGAVTLGANRTVTTSAKTLTIGGAIGDGGSNFTLTKDGAGNLALDGANTYGGATTIAAGTLGGNGSIPGSVTVQDGAGLYAKIADWTGAAGSGYSDLATGAVTIDAGSHTVVIDTTGMVNFTESAKTFTILNASGISGFNAVDFSISTINFTGTGTWSIQQTVNSLELVYAAGTPLGYAGWALTNAPTGNENDDYDKDGVPNAVEYVLGGDKNTNDAGKLPTIDTTGGNMTFSFIRPWDSLGYVELTVEVGADLQTWPDQYPVPDNVVTANPGLSVVDNGNTTDTVTLVLPISSGTTKFARLNVVVIP